MKEVLKKTLRKQNLSIVNTKYRWGVDLYSDIMKMLKSDRLLTVVDVGANEGKFAEEMLSSLPIKKLYTLEPGLTAFGRLSERFSDNQLVKSDRFAVGEQRGKVTLYTFADSKKNTLDAALRDEMRSDEGNPEDIEMISLEEYAEMNQVNAIDFVKIDVEGNELSVLKGAKGLLSKGNIKLIFCEFHKIMKFENNNSAHTDLASLVEYLAPFDYRFVSLFTQGVHKSESIVTCNVLFAYNGLFKNQ